MKQRPPKKTKCQDETKTAPQKTIEKQNNGDETTKEKCQDATTKNKTN